VGRKKKPDKNKKSPLLVVICGWLLGMESFLFFLLGVYHFQFNNGPALFSHLFSQWLRGETPVNFDTVRVFVARLLVNASSAQLLTALIESAILFLLTILALWSAVGFFRLWRIAWTAGLFVQVGTLLTALVLYFTSQPFHILFMMIAGIFMVIYLNYAEVHTYFNRQFETERSRVKCT
jgi:hypothetical protein